MIDSMTVIQYIYSLFAHCLKKYKVEVAHRIRKSNDQKGPMSSKYVLRNERVSNSYVYRSTYFFRPSYIFGYRNIMIFSKHPFS